MAATDLLFQSPMWLWERNKTWPVQPVAALAKANRGEGIILKCYDKSTSLKWQHNKTFRASKKAKVAI